MLFPKVLRKVEAGDAGGEAAATSLSKDNCRGVRHQGRLLREVAPADEQQAQAH